MHNEQERRDLAVTLSVLGWSLGMLAFVVALAAHGDGRVLGLAAATALMGVLMGWAGADRNSPSRTGQDQRTHNNASKRVPRYGRSGSGRKG